MKSPYDLPAPDLADLVASIQQKLYLERDPGKVFVWNPGKDIDCQGFVEELDELMGRLGLHPARVELRRPFVHRPNEIEFLEREEMSGAARNPELSIKQGALIGHLAPNFKRADIVFAPTMTRILLLGKRDVEDLRALCDGLLEYLKD